MTRATRLSLAAAILIVGCKQHESPAPQPKRKDPATSKIGSSVTRGTLKRSNVETEYGVAVAVGSDVAALEKLARAKGPKLEVTRSSLADLFSAEQLKYLTPDLPQADVDGLKASPAVILLHGSGPDAMKLAREIAGAASDVADAAHGWVLDPETFKIYPAAAFHDHVPGEHPDARKLLMVHSIMGDNEQPFLDTAGLHRYGFPELYFAEAATGNIKQVTHLINGVAQTLLDGGDVNERGEIAIDFKKLGWDMNIIGEGTGKAVVKARWAKERDARDDDEPVVELVPPGGASTEAASALLDECFGHAPDKITMLDHDDPELLAAEGKARADLTKLRSHFAKGIPPEERLVVKARFTGEDDQVEWMWVDVVSFKGNTFAGTLANDPELIKSLRDGQKVKVKLADVGDYLHETKDAKPAGGYSIELMRKRGLLPPE